MQRRVEWINDLHLYVACNKSMNQYIVIYV